MLLLLQRTLEIICAQSISSFNIISFHLQSLMTRSSWIMYQLEIWLPMESQKDLQVRNTSTSFSCLDWKTDDHETNFVGIIIAFCWQNWKRHNNYLDIINCQSWFLSLNIPPKDHIPNFIDSLQNSQPSLRKDVIQNLMDLANFHSSPMKNTIYLIHLAVITQYHQAHSYVLHLWNNSDTSLMKIHHNQIYHYYHTFHIPNLQKGPTKQGNQSPGGPNRMHILL